MNPPLVFKPRPSLGWLWLALIGLAVIVPTIMPLVNGGSGIGSDPILVGILILTLVIGGIFLGLAAMFPTMRYELRADELALIYGPWTLYRIPYPSIDKVSWQNLSISMWSSMRLPGLALFDVQYSDMGSVKMCATAAATRILLITAGKAKYGITPSDEEAFISALTGHIKR